MIDNNVYISDEDLANFSFSTLEEAKKHRDEDGSEVRAVYAVNVKDYIEVNR